MDGGADVVAAEGEQRGLKKPRNTKDAEMEPGEAVETPEVVDDWKLVDLPVITPLTGEEGHTELARLRGKVYKF